MEICHLKQMKSLKVYYKLKINDLLGFGIETWLQITSASIASGIASNWIKPDELLSAKFRNNNNYNKSKC